MLSLRIRVLFGFFCFLSFLVLGKLFYWQIIYREKFQTFASSQYFQEKEVFGERGIILASDGFPLVVNKKLFSVYVFLPQIKKSPEEIALSLGEILEPSLKEEIKNKLEIKDLNWVPLAKRIEKEKKEKIENLSFSGIFFEEENVRDYPEGSMAAQLLGFLGKDAAGKNKGYFGLEGFYDRLLSGKPGIIRHERDALGKPILIGEKFEDEAVNGKNLELYLDRTLQFLIEEKLKRGIERYGAKSGLVVLMDPKNGGILAMASFPNYHPSDYAKTEEKLFLNPVIAESFEPGSIFKVLVMAAAINENVVAPEDRCPKCFGPLVIGEYTIKTWNEKYHPNETMTEIIQYSDNVGMAYVAEKLGVEKLLEYLEKFGFGKETGIDLEGEISPPLRRKEEWSQIDLATAGFGQGIAVTPIQMVTAVSVIANGGKLLEPHVVHLIKDDEKEVEIKPKVRREIISSRTAKIITEMMVNAVENGEAKWAKPKGYRIAGKTGTAQIPIAGHYDKEKTIASFIGFAPAYNPRFVMLVSLREPTSSPWGSETAAPLWFEIAKEIFIHWGILPE